MLLGMDLDVSMFEGLASQKLLRNYVQVDTSINDHGI